MEVSSIEFEEDIEYYQDVALKEPVFIIKDSQPHIVMISFAYYKLLTKGRQVFRTEDLSPEQVQAITDSRMDPRHDHLNDLLEE